MFRGNFLNSFPNGYDEARKVFEEGLETMS